MPTFLVRFLQPIFSQRRVVTNEILGALVLAHSLRDAGTTKKLAVLVTLDGVTAEAVVQLKVRFRVKICVCILYIGGHFANLRFLSSFARAIRLFTIMSCLLLESAMTSPPTCTS